MTYQVHAYRGAQYCTITRKTAGGALYMCRALHKLGWLAFYQRGEV